MPAPAVSQRVFVELVSSLLAVEALLLALRALLA
jgi:hypothetical protein